MVTSKTTDNPLTIAHDLNDVKRVNAREARNQFADLIGQVHYTGEPVIIERSGKPMVAVIPVALLEQHLASSSSTRVTNGDEPPQTQPLIREAAVSYRPTSTQVDAPLLTSSAAPAPQAEGRSATERSQFGLFPELAVIEFGDDFDAIKQLWRDSITKQLDIIQGTAHS